MLLADIMGKRLRAVLIRENRERPDQILLKRANANEDALKKIVSNTQVEIIDVFGDDGAAVGGMRIAERLNGIAIDESITDVVLDLSALSIGIGFPAAKILLEDSEAAENCAFHLFCRLKS